jgi:hypothetical protein
LDAQPVGASTGLDARYLTELQYRLCSCKTHCSVLQNYSGPAYIHYGRIYKDKEHYECMIQDRLETSDDASRGRLIDPLSGSRKERRGGERGVSLSQRQHGPTRRSKRPYGHHRASQDDVRRDPDYVQGRDGSDDDDLDDSFSGPSGSPLVDKKNVVVDDKKNVVGDDKKNVVVDDSDLDDSDDSAAAADENVVVPSTCSVEISTQLPSLPPSTASDGVDEAGSPLCSQGALGSQGGVVVEQPSVAPPPERPAAAAAELEEAAMEIVVDSDESSTRIASAVAVPSSLHVVVEQLGVVVDAPVEDGGSSEDVLNFDIRTVLGPEFGRQQMRRDESLPGGVLGGSSLVDDVPPLSPAQRTSAAVASAIVASAPALGRGATVRDVRTFISEQPGGVLFRQQRLRTPNNPVFGRPHVLRPPVRKTYSSDDGLVDEKSDVDVEAENTVTVYYDPDHRSPSTTSRRRPAAAVNAAAAAGSAVQQHSHVVNDDGDIDDDEAKDPSFSRPPRTHHSSKKKKDKSSKKKNKKKRSLPLSDNDDAVVKIHKKRRLSKKVGSEESASSPGKTKD